MHYKCNDWTLVSEGAWFRRGPDGANGVFGVASCSQSSSFSCVGALMIPIAHVARYGVHCNPPSAVFLGSVDANMDEVSVFMSCAGSAAC